MCFGNACVTGPKRLSILTVRRLIFLEPSWPCALCDHAPRSTKRHLVKEEIDEWQSRFNSWVDRCEKKIKKRKVDPEELKRLAADEFTVLHQAGVSMPRPMWLGDVKKDLASIEGGRL